MSFLSYIPFQCAVCLAWPRQSSEGVTGICDRCVQRHATAPHFAKPTSLDDCIAAVNFDTPWAALISRYKFSPEPGMARVFAGLMLRMGSVQHLLREADVMMPLPLAPERLEERGFNQAFALAKRLTAARKIDAASLVRTRNTSPQRLLDKEARQRNVANAFALQGVGQEYVQGRHVLLVDDVMTTGATLAAAAAPLRRAGASRISAVVIARTALNDSGLL